MENAKIQNIYTVKISSFLCFLNARSFLASSMMILRFRSRSSFKSKLRFSVLARKQKTNIHGCLIMIVTLAQICTAIALFNAETSVVLMLKIRPTKKFRIQRSVLIKVACSGILRQSEIEETSYYTNRMKVQGNTDFIRSRVRSEGQ